MKSAEDRDEIVRAEKVIAFDMESAGVCGSFPFVIIKVVCDYADSPKDKAWQPYSAAAVAAAVRAFLDHWVPLDAQEAKEHHGPLVQGFCIHSHYALPTVFVRVVLAVHSPRPLPEKRIIRRPRRTSSKSKRACRKRASPF